MRPSGAGTGSLSSPPMSRFFFYVRLTLVWLLVWVVAEIILTRFTHRGMGYLFLAWLVVMVFVYASAHRHILRVRQIVPDATGSAFANRQRRLIEMPLDSGHAFDIV